MGDMTNELLTVKDAAAYLHVTPLTLARWRKAGTGPNWSQPGKKVLYRKSDLDAWVDARSVVATTS